MDQSLEEQAKFVVRLLKEKAKLPQKLHRDSPIFAKALEWIRIAPGKLDPGLRAELIENLAAAFELEQKDIIGALEGIAIHFPQNGFVVRNEEEELEALLPKGGWFENYIEYTRYTESPLSYHLMSGMVALGCALGRRCYIDQGHYKLFAPINVMLIGPTGVVHKSSAVDVARNLIRETALCPIMADKITAEAMASALVACPQQFVYAPELSVFFGKQRYNEGLTNLILRLLDYPVEWVVETIGRGAELLVEPTLSILGGSTVSLLNSSAGEVTSGGFLNRFLVVVENDSPRIFRRPRKGGGEQMLIRSLNWLKSYSGEIKVTEGGEADQIYDEWYTRRKKRLREDPTLAEVIQRGSDHLLRLAMLIHIIECNTNIICGRCFHAAVSLLEHLERKAPTLVKAISSTTQTTFSDLVLEKLVHSGGMADHSNLLRKCSSRMNATQFKAAIQTLNESGQIRVSKKGVAHHYVLVTKEESNAIS